MRTWACALVVISTLAHADDTTRIRVRRLESTPGEPLLRLTPLAADAEGGLLDRKTTLVDIGPRTRLAVEGTWWQSGLAPSMFSTDLEKHGWRAAAELSYDLGPFSVGVNASLTREGDSSHRAVGLFAFRKFRFSRWTQLWIVLGVSYEEFQLSNGTSQNGTSVGLRIGGTFR
jgi:hypothetical protein